jgi:hypothetical protein
MAAQAVANFAHHLHDNLQSENSLSLVCNNQIRCLKSQATNVHSVHQDQFFPHATHSTTRALAFKQINILMTTIHIGELDIQGQTSKRQTIAGELQWP